MIQVDVAVVKDRDDPQNRGRLRLQCDRMLQGGMLPYWYEKLAPVYGSDKAGFFGTPDVDSKVLLITDENEFAHKHRGWWLSIESVGNHNPGFYANQQHMIGFMSVGGYAIFVSKESAMIGKYANGRFDPKLELSTDVKIQVGSTGFVVSSTGVSANANSVNLGTGASHPLIAGDVLQQSMITYFTAMQTAANVLGASAASPIDVLTYANAVAAVQAVALGTIATWISAISKTG